MNNNNCECFSALPVLIPPAPFSCKQKKGVKKAFSPSLLSREGLG